MELWRHAKYNKYTPRVNTVSVNTGWRSENNSGQSAKRRVKQSKRKTAIASFSRLIGNASVFLSAALRLFRTGSAITKYIPSDYGQPVIAFAVLYRSVSVLRNELHSIFFFIFFFIIFFRYLAARFADFIPTSFSRVVLSSRVRDPSFVLTILTFTIRGNQTRVINDEIHQLRLSRFFQRMNIIFF